MIITSLKSKDLKFFQNFLNLLLMLDDRAIIKLHSKLGDCPKCFDFLIEIKLVWLKFADHFFDHSFFTFSLIARISETEKTIYDSILHLN